MTMTAARSTYPTISPSSQWQLVTPDVLLTDEMGTPVNVDRTNRRSIITYSDSGEIAPALTRQQRIYINWLAYDIIAGEDNLYVRPRPDYALL